MDKTFKIFLCVVVLGLFIGVFIAMNVPKPCMNIYEDIDLRNEVQGLNSDLPRTIGTIGTIDSIIYRHKTIRYNMTAFGDNRIKESICRIIMNLRIF